MGLSDAMQPMLHMMPFDFMPMGRPGITVSSGFVQPGHGWQYNCMLFLIIF
jgi:hypothetical protein